MTLRPFLPVRPFFFQFLKVDPVLVCTICAETKRTEGFALCTAFRLPLTQFLKLFYSCQCLLAFPGSLKQCVCFKEYSLLKHPHPAAYPTYPAPFLQDVLRSSPACLQRLVMGLTCSRYLKYLMMDSIFLEEYVCFSH